MYLWLHTFLIYRRCVLSATTHIYTKDNQRDNAMKHRAVLYGIEDTLCAIYSAKIPHNILRILELDVRKSSCHTLTEYHSRAVDSMPALSYGNRYTFEHITQSPKCMAFAPVHLITAHIDYVRPLIKIKKSLWTYRKAWQHGSDLLCKPCVSRVIFTLGPRSES